MLIAVIVTISYLVSLRLHPRGSICSKCKGTGIHRGLFFTYAHRACTKWRNSVRARYGVRVVHRNKQVWGERKPQEAAKKRNFGR